MKVKFLQSGCGHGFGYFVGSEANIDDEKAALLIEKNICAKIDDSESNCQLPANIPSRKKLEKAGAISIDDLTSEFLKDVNLSKKEVEELSAYLAQE